MFLDDEHMSAIWFFLSRRFLNFQLWMFLNKSSSLFVSVLGRASAKGGHSRAMTSPQGCCAPQMNQFWINLIPTENINKKFKRLKNLVEMKMLEKKKINLTPVVLMMLHYASYLCISVEWTKWKNTILI